MENPISRIFGWLVPGLGLQDPATPVKLEVGDVRSVLDVGQGGFGTAQWVIRQVAQPASTGVTNYEIEPRGQNDLQFLITQFRLVRTGGVDPTQSFLRLLMPDSALVIEQAAFNVPTGATMPSNACLPYGPVLIPPGLGFEWRVPTTIAGEAWDCRLVYAKIRTGYKPI